MTSEQDLINTIVNAVRIHCSDVNQHDMDGGSLNATRASKSYWIDYGWIGERWKEHGLPQISIYNKAARGEAEGLEGERYEMNIIEIGIFATGNVQRTSFGSQVKRGLFSKAPRISLKNSGVKVDRLLSEFDSKDDDMLPQEVYIKEIDIKVYYHTSGG